MIYRVVYASPANQRHFEKTLARLPAHDQDAVMDAIKGLYQNPRPHGVTKLEPPVIVSRYTAHYRIKVGHYRVLYDIDDDRKVVFLLVLRKRNEKTYE